MCGESVDGVIWLRAGTSWDASEENNERFDSLKRRELIAY
jgi:hypothetical protein